MRVCVCDTLNCARTLADLCRVNVCQVCPLKDLGRGTDFLRYYCGQWPPPL